MGTWGADNFANDTTLDWFGPLVEGWLAEIAEAIASPDCLEPDEYEGNVVPAQLELLCVLAESGRHVPWPDAGTLTAWRDTFLTVWEDTIDDLEPTPEYRAERRQVLASTFDRALALATRA